MTSPQDPQVIDARVEGRAQTDNASLIGRDLPDADGRFGPFGGRFVPETLMPALMRLERTAREALRNPGYLETLDGHLRDWVGRPTALCHADQLSDAWRGDVWLKREDLAHTGAHKINNAVGQALLAKHLGARRVVAETGAGQHGVATAAACARVGIPCTIYMGAIDARRQAPNVDRMHQMGAKLVQVTTGDQTLRAAIDEAIRDWVSDPDGTYYLLGSVVGPHPYPWLVREFQSVIGREARQQLLDRTGGLPHAVAACVGGGSNAIGLFHAFLRDPVELIGYEAGGSPGGRHAASIGRGTPGVLHGCYSLIVQDEWGQMQETESIAAGLDYPAVGPEHAFLHSIGRARYESVSDDEALDALDDCCKREGILPALESAHALAGAKRWCTQHSGTTILVGLSGRGDKDLATVANSRSGS
jgi:tryptophan synthase beta chain